MVKLGIICEGPSEPVILNTDLFRSSLANLNIELIEVVTAGSKTQYRADLIEKHRLILLDKGAEKIVVLVDLDKDVCITFTKQVITPFPDQFVIVAVKEWENWYLADEVALSQFVGGPVSIEYPEQDEDAITTIINLGIESRRFKRFRKGKPLLAEKMRDNGFTIEAAARHPNCPSAQYFLTTLQTLASAN